MSKKKRAAEEEALHDDSDRITAEYLARLALESVRMEDSRGEGLTGYAGHLMTALSIIVVALVTVAEPLFSCFSSVWQREILLAAYLLSMLCYAAGFVLCLLAVRRRKYCVLDSPKSISDALEGVFASELDAARTTCDSLEAYYASRKAYDDRTVSLLRAANALILIATGVVALAVVFFSVVGFVLIAS